MHAEDDNRADQHGGQRLTTPGPLRRADTPEVLVPYVNIQITRGATREQKKQLVARVTATLVEVLGKRPEHTHIVIQEVADEDWGFAGLLTDDWRANAKAQDAG